jgi:hypothetical protein
MLDLIAVIVVIVAIVAALAHAGYLAMLNSAAKRRGISGNAASTYVRGRWPIAGATTLGALIALWFTSGGGFLDVLAILLAAGSGGVALKSLEATQKRYKSDS